MRILDYLGHAYIINLPNRKDRRAETRRELKRIGIDPSDPRVQFFEATRPTDKGGFPTLGARGCYMSHLNVLKHARAQGHERVWILEDDVSFHPAWRSLEEDIVRQLQAQPDWWMCYLGWALVGQESRLGSGPPTVEASDEVVSCMHCYAVQQQCFDPLIDYLESCLTRPGGHPDGGPMHVDGALLHFRRRTPEAKTMICKPGIAGQRPSRTDVHDQSLLRRLPVTREVFEALRRGKRLAIRLGLLRG